MALPPLTMACCGFWPPITAASTGFRATAFSVTSPGAPSSSRASMTVSISTWLISSVPMSMIMSLYFARDAAAPALPQVLHHDGHLTELAAEDLLELHREQCVGLLGLGGELQFTNVAVHPYTSRQRSGTPTVGWICVGRWDGR